VHDIEPGAVYRHYKGGYYRVICGAKHTETGEVMVVYEHVHPHPATTFVRPAVMFFGHTADGEQRFRRLETVGDLPDDAELSRIICQLIRPLVSVDPP
jgi:hypothetical protein